MAIVRKGSKHITGKWTWTGETYDSKEEVEQAVMDVCDFDVVLYDMIDGWTARDPDGKLYDVVVEVRLEARNAT